MNTKPGRYYNRLEGEAREWAASNRFAKSEFCVPVKKGKKFGGPQWIRDKCGDGRMGFSTRRKGQDEVRIEVGLDGQFKRKRHTLVRRRSALATATRRTYRVDGSRCILVCQTRIIEAQRDPIVVAQQRKVSRKFKRAEKRNGRARRGHKRAMKVAA